MKKILRSIVISTLGGVFALTSCNLAENVERDLVLSTSIDLFDSFIDVNLGKP